MPIYQYRGRECEHEFEVRQSFADDALTTCEICGKPVRRVIHASPIVFKGPGWYHTDSRPSSDPVGGVKDSGKKPESTSGDAKTPESKPAAKTEKAPAAAKAD